MSGPPRILVTGATGFLGRAVARRLLACGQPVTVLARARQGQSAETRVSGALGISARAADLEVVEGDLGEFAAGLRAPDRGRLRDRVSTVINCAGEAEFYPEYPERFRAAHVEGPASLLESLAGGRLRAWAQLSTAYVCGRRTGVILETEGDVGQAFHNPYERVKLEAETAIRAAGARRHLDVRVFRPSAVVGRAPDTPGGAPSERFFRFIRLAAALVDRAPGAIVPLRIEAAPAARFNIVPLGYVARSVALLARCAEGEGQTFHLVVSDPPRQDAMLAMITERLDVRGFTAASACAARAELSPLERRVRVMLERYRDYLNHEVRFDDGNARRALACHGLAPATLGPTDVHRLIARGLRGRRSGQARTR